ncbi:hypothetical protein [Bacteroidetes bacterium endosymbiont of Geopemphigus sp.]|uniref:hypothetical protein n=1 Tax=Bacteroidetes bacterium endosymbiont of Geopemphigus sp. TaxID=2047937 RepID=UPI000CD1E828|nr:hypothetical protein [Bacteroidetes bacterium endosymbiont of Geopemphigus sp.]
MRDQVDIDNSDTDQSKISLISRPEIWSLANVPRGGNPNFPNGDKENDLSSGYYLGMISS